MYRVLTLIFLVFFISLSNANQKPVLNVVSESWTGTTNKDGTGTYWAIVKAVYGDKYRLNLKTESWSRAVEMVRSGSADILVGTNAQSAESLLLSEQHIDIEYPLHIIYDPKNFTPSTMDDLNGKLIAGKNDNGIESYLPKKAKFFGVDSITDIGRLIHNNRIDGALTYSYNLRSVDPEMQLSNKELVPEIPLYLAFTSNETGEKLRVEFEQGMSELIQRDELSQHFSSDIEFQHANLNFHSNKTRVDWHLMPKIFNKTTQKLDVTPWELESSQYISSQLSGIKIDFKVNSFKETKNYLLNNERTCSINVRKFSAGKEKLLFSEPLYAFIKPRLFTLKGSQFENELNALLLNDKLDINEVLEQHPTLSIVVKKDTNIYKELRNSLSDIKFKRIIGIDEQGDYKKFVHMLNTQRTDAFIMWPSIIFDIHEVETINKLVSYTLEEPLSNSLFTYIACHKDKVGIEIINQVNQLLRSEHHNNIYSPILKTMDTNSAKIFIKALNNKH